MILGEFDSLICIIKSISRNLMFYSMLLVVAYIFIYNFCFSVGDDMHYVLLYGSHLPMFQLGAV